MTATLAGIPGPALADPVYEGPLLLGLDPVIRETEDPRFLGVDRLVLLRRMETLGVDLRKHPDRRPGLESSFRKYFITRSNVDLERSEHLVEYNGKLGLMTEIQYPSFFFLFPSPETLPGGFLYYPPRPLDDPVVRIFVDEIEQGADRRHAVGQVFVRTDALPDEFGGRHRSRGFLGGIDFKKTARFDRGNK